MNMIVIKVVGLHDFTPHFSNLWFFLGEGLRVGVEDAARNNIGRVLSTNFSSVKSFWEIFFQFFVDVVHELAENFFNEWEKRLNLTGQAINEQNIKAHRNLTLAGEKAGATSPRFSFHSSPRNMTGFRAKIGSLSLFV